MRQITDFFALFFCTITFIININDVINLGYTL